MKGKRLSRWQYALLVMGALLAVVTVINPLADAQPVGNPGALNFKIVGGVVRLGGQVLPLDPKPGFECSDGENNDGDAQGGADGQDTLIDFPADPECTAANDNSEAHAGYDPKQDSTITGTVTAAGVVTVPQANFFFPPTYQYAQGGVLTVQVRPQSASTGTINPMTGVATLTASLKLFISGSAGGFDLGDTCGIGPFTMNLRTGATTPPAPYEPLVGTPYDAATGQGEFVDNNFAVPAATNCALLGAGSGPLSAAFGVPAPAGVSFARLRVEATPKIAKGVSASNVPSVTSGNAPLTVSFNGTGSTAVKPITSYAWDFGDGHTATGNTAVNTYATPGTYNAKLTVTDSDGDKDTSIKTITVNVPPNVPPTAAIGSSGSGGVAPYAVTFDGSASSDPDGSIVSYLWDFGNDRTATTAVASANYTQPGTYTARLTVTDNVGGTGTATKVIVVTGAPNVPPTAVIRTVSVAGTIPLTVNLSGGNSTDPDGSIATYAWDLGNGQTATGASAQAIYTEAGSYTVTLVVTDDRGATATQTLTIEVSEDSNIAPGADFSATPSSGAAPLSVSFDGSASADVDGTIASYAWNFGNGQNGSGATPPAVTYTLPGSYTATLTVTDNKGATGTSSQVITVNRPPNVSPTAQVAATPGTGAAPQLVQLSSAGSVDPDGAITGYAWNFGNGQTSTSPNPSATFNVAGTYTVQLTVTDNDGASSVKSTTVVIQPANVAPVPVIVANPLTGSAPLAVTVNGASSTDSDGSIASYAWDFGNGQTATTPVASVTYNSQGTYVIRLTVTDNRGKTATTTKNVVAGTTNVRPVAIISALPTSGPAPLLVTLNSAGSNDPDGSISTYAWNFGDGRTATGTATQVSYATPGTYVVQLTVTDNKGASTAATETVVVDQPVANADRVRVQYSGALSYGYDGRIKTGTVQISRDIFGLSGVASNASYQGPGGSTGTVTVSLSRFFIFNAFSGTVTVNDPTNGVNNVTTNLLLSPLTSPSASSARGSGTGTLANPTRSYALSFTLDDRVA